MCLCGQEGQWGALGRLLLAGQRIVAKQVIPDEATPGILCPVLAPQYENMELLD